MAKHISKFNAVDKRALELFHEGFTIIPTAGKKPLILDWPNATPATTDTISNWDPSTTGAGMLTGMKHSILVIDLDEQDGKKGISKEIALELLGDTYIEKTIGNGYHGFYKGLFPIETRMGAIIEVRGSKIKMDILNGNRQCVIAPTPGYSAVNNKQMKTSVPNWVYETCKSINDKPMDYSTMFKNGSRDNNLFNLAKYCRDQGMPINEAYSTVINAGKVCSPPVDEKTCMVKVDSAYTRTSTSDQYWKLVEESKGLSRMITRRDLKEITGLSDTGLTEKINMWISTDKLARLNHHGEFVIRELAKEPVERIRGTIPRIKIKWPFYMEHLIPSITIGDTSLWSAVTNSGKSIAALYWLLVNRDFNGQLIYFMHQEAGAAKFNEQLQDVCNSLKITVDEAWDRVEFLKAPSDRVYLGLFPHDAALIAIDHVVDNEKSCNIGNIVKEINEEAKKVKGHVMIFTQAHAANANEKGSVARTYGGESGSQAAQNAFIFDSTKVQILKSKESLVGLDGKYSLDGTTVEYRRSTHGIGWNIDRIHIPQVPDALESRIMQDMRKGAAKEPVFKKAEKMERATIQRMDKAGIPEPKPSKLNFDPEFVPED